MTSFLLKIIGIITMLCDHISDGIIGKFAFLNYIGRIAFPIFAFQAVQGYIYTKNFKKHMIKMLIFACISQIPFMFFISTFSTDFSLNIFFTFFLGLFALYIFDKCENKFLGTLVILLISALGQLIKVDYGAFGVLLIFVFYIFNSNKIEFKNISIKNFISRYNKILMTICVSLLCIIKFLPIILKTPMYTKQYLLCALFTAFSMFFILLYNKKQGPKTKYFFYIFYPLHMIIIYFIHTIFL